jgi:hypothetical protein
VADFLKLRLKVQTKGGVQSVTTNVTQITSPIPNVTNETLVFTNLSGGMVNFWMQLASVSYATRALLLGDVILLSSTALQLASGESAMPFKDNRTASQPAFLDKPVGSNASDTQFVWGDVLKRIEEMSHNVSAALLTLHLGTRSAECFFDKQTVVYQYRSFALWAPYGVSNFFLLSCHDLTFSPIMFYRRPWALL